MSYTNVTVMQPLAICIILSIQVREAKKVKKNQIFYLNVTQFRPPANYLCS